MGEYFHTIFLVIFSIFDVVVFGSRLMRRHSSLTTVLSPSKRQRKAFGLWRWVGRLIEGSNGGIKLIFQIKYVKYSKYSNIQIFQIKYVSARDAGQYECQVRQCTVCTVVSISNFFIPPAKKKHLQLTHILFLLMCSTKSYLNRSVQNSKCYTTRVHCFVFKLMWWNWKVSTVPKVSRWIDLVVVVPKVSMLLLLCEFLSFFLSFCICILLFSCVKGIRVQIYLDDSDFAFLHKSVFAVRQIIVILL